MASHRHCPGPDCLHRIDQRGYDRKTVLRSTGLSTLVFYFILTIPIGLITQESLYKEETMLTDLDQNFEDKKADSQLQSLKDYVVLHVGAYKMRMMPTLSSMPATIMKAKRSTAILPCSCTTRTMRKSSPRCTETSPSPPARRKAGHLFYQPAHGYLQVPIRNAPPNVKGCVSFVIVLV